MSRNVRKRTFRYMRLTRIQINLRIRAVWSVYVVRMKNFLPLTIQKAPSEDSDQMHSLMWIFAARHVLVFNQL